MIVLLVSLLVLVEILLCMVHGGILLPIVRFWGASQGWGTVNINLGYKCLMPPPASNVVKNGALILSPKLLTCRHITGAKKTAR